MLHRQREREKEIEGIEREGWLAWLEATAKSFDINQSIRHDLFHCHDMLHDYSIRAQFAQLVAPRLRERPRLRPSWPPAPAPTSASVPRAGHVWAHVLVSLSGHVASAVGLICIYFPTLSPHMCVRGLNNVFFTSLRCFFNFASG